MPTTGISFVDAKQINDSNNICPLIIRRDFSHWVLRLSELYFLVVIPLYDENANDVEENLLYNLLSTR